MKLVCRHASAIPTALQHFPIEQVVFVAEWRSKGADVPTTDVSRTAARVTAAAYGLEFVVSPLATADHVGSRDSVWEACLANDLTGVKLRGFPILVSNATDMLAGALPIGSTSLSPRSIYVRHLHRRSLKPWGSAVVHTFHMPGRRRVMCGRTTFVAADESAAARVRSMVGQREREAIAEHLGLADLPASILWTNPFGVSAAGLERSDKAYRRAAAGWLRANENVFVVTKLHPNLQRLWPSHRPISSSQFIPNTELLHALPLELLSSLTIHTALIGYPTSAFEFFRDSHLWLDFGPKTALTKLHEFTTKTIPVFGRVPITAQVG